MADSPLTNTDGPVSVTIKVDGAAIADDYQVARLQVDKGVGRLPEAVVVLMTGSIAENEFPASDGDDFKIGKEISLAAAYGSGQDQEIFKGVIVSKRLRFARGTPSLEVTCIDTAAQLTYTRKSGFYEDSKDSDVMSKIIGDAGLTAAVTATTDAPRDILRYACTDWGYLRSLADRSGFVVTVEDGTVTIGPPDVDAAAVLTVTLGMDMLSFDASVDAQTTLGGAKAQSWDSTSQEAVEETGAAASPPTWGTYRASDLADVMGQREYQVSTAREMPAADLKTALDARTMRSALAVLQGVCSFTGSSRAVPGAVIELAGVGHRFGGQAFVSGVRHSVEDGEWRTEATLGLPDIWNVDSTTFESESAAGLTAPIHGLQIGTVMQLDEDPGGKMRIKVTLPMLADPAPAVWARYAQPYASNGAGLQFMPELADEVLVGFLNADPDAPVVLGSLHNGKAEQANPPTSENFIKAIVTREALKLEFDDDKKVITLETPGGHKLTLDDTSEAITLNDMTGNRIEMDSAGITLSSPGDISLSADGAVTIAATLDASVTGLNVTAEADTGLTVKGGATAEISSSGQTTVKGSIVMIN